MGNAECIFEKKTCPVLDNGISQKACSRNRRKKKKKRCRCVNGPCLDVRVG